MKVYVVRANNGHVKVGVSGEPEMRLVHLRTATPFDLELVHVEPTEWAKDVERAAHKLLHARHLKGEWFDVTPAEAIDAVKPAAASLAQKQPKRARRGRGANFCFDAALLGRVDADARRLGISRTAWLHVAANAMLDRGK